MWLSNSSVGRKAVMALSGAVLVLFVTFHCLMNAVAICWPTAYNSVCEFLGANWYALIASVALAAFIVLHIIYAVMLTLQNRKARGNVRYAVSYRPAGVEWSSQNMFVLGIVILAFLVVHLIQFWAKMQLQEIRGVDELLPPAAGTLFIQEAFQTPWTLIVYGIGFVALWFHLNHGMWSMFQSVGWNNTNWMPRLKCISFYWTSIVVLLFLAQGIVFTVKAHEKYYLTNPDLREQYKEMILPMMMKDLGPDAAGLMVQFESMPYEQTSEMVGNYRDQLEMSLKHFNTPEGQEMLKNNPQLKEQIEMGKKMKEGFDKGKKFFDYLESADQKPKSLLPASAGQPF